MTNDPACPQHQADDLKQQLERKNDMLISMEEWLPNWHLYGQGVLRGRLKVGDVMTGLVVRHIPVLRKASGADESDIDRALRKLCVGDCTAAPYRAADSHVRHLRYFAESTTGKVSVVTTLSPASCPHVVLRSTRP